MDERARTGSFSLESPRTAFVALCGALLVCALWLPLRGEVIYTQLDLHQFFVPEMDLHLNGEHAFGPALWNPYVQLGRPTTHFGGLSQAYWPTILVGFLFDDVW